MVEEEEEEGGERRRRTQSQLLCSDDWAEERGGGGLFCSSEALDGCRWKLEEVRARAVVGEQGASTRLRHSATPHPLYPTQLHEEASFLVPISSGEWHTAANNGDLETMRKLLDEGTDVNMVDELGFTGVNPSFPHPLQTSSPPALTPLGS